MATERAADLIVMGVHGRGAIDLVVFWSTAPTMSSWGVELPGADCAAGLDSHPAWLAVQAATVVLTVAILSNTTFKLLAGLIAAAADSASRLRWCSAEWQSRPR